jgi:mono/diheme cytochrome c family protein
MSEGLFSRSGMLAVGLVLAAPVAGTAAEPAPGAVIFATYCASCHGATGAGLVGPNLTDRVFLHGGTRADILRTITEGVGDKGMPSWSAILPPKDLAAVADFTFGLIGLNLTSQQVVTAKSQVTPFPQGTEGVPLLLRTFMPTLGIAAEVFHHHQQGQPVAKYDEETGGDVPGMELPIDGVPSVIAVNFGTALSYAFDTTECRVLYTWSGKFLDMTRYWGSAAGGSRKKNDYLPIILGPVGWIASGPEAIRVPAADSARLRFLGYRKVGQVPELRWRAGGVEFSLRITPGAKPGVARCSYATQGAVQGLEIPCTAGLSCDQGTIRAGVQVLSATEATSFTLTITPDEHPVRIPGRGTADAAEKSSKKETGE